MRLDQAARPGLILASASTTRSRLLSAAGIPHAVHPADIDESREKARWAAERTSPATIALLLAELKAKRVAAKRRGAMVIGADQILVCGDRIFDKPSSSVEATDHLRHLSGRTHTLPTAVVLVRDEEIVWRHVAAPALVMRPLSDLFIASYIATVGSEVSRSVGGYQIEGLGAQLFSRIEGDFFAVLGLPLLPLLAELRHQGILSA